MKGLTMDYQLTLTQIFERTRKLFHRKTLATRVPGLGLQRYTYADYALAMLTAETSPGTAQRGRLSS